MAVSRLILREQLQALGWPGLLGAGCAGLALAIGLLAVLPAWQARTAVQQSVRPLADAPPALASAAAESPPAAPHEALAQLQHSLPAQRDATMALDRLYRLAAQQQLTLERGEYALGIDPRTQLARYQMLLPVRGRYPQLRRFLQALQAELPALVLEAFEVQRAHIGTAELSGRLRLTLYLSRTPG